MMINPGKLPVQHLPSQLRREAERRAHDDGQGVAIYVLVYRRRARRMATRFAIATVLSGLAVAWLMSVPWLALAGLVASPLVHAAACWRMEGLLGARLGLSRKALSAYAARFMASPEGIATAAMLERGAAQVRIDDRQRPA